MQYYKLLNSKAVMAKGLSCSCCHSSDSYKKKKKKIYAEELSTCFPKLQSQEGLLAGLPRWAFSAQVPYTSLCAKNHVEDKNNGGRSMVFLHLVWFLLEG